MRQLHRGFSAWILGMSMFWSGASMAQDLRFDESAAIIAVVQAQLEAFAADDADTAFEMASDETKAVVGSPQALLGVVREWYPPLYRPHKAEFAPAEVMGSNALQEVTITDDNGLVWIAIFVMTLDDDESWKIDSYHLEQTTSMDV